MKMQESVTDNKVGGKTPEEIKKGLECCSDISGSCEGVCPYFMVDGCLKQCKDDAIAYIHRLEADLQREKDQHQYTIDAANVMKDEVLKLESRLAQAERERDAALAEWKRTKIDSESMCWTCKHGLIVNSGCCRCVSPFPCDEGEEWEWRGVCPENTKEDKDHAN